VGLAKKPET